MSHRPRKRFGQDFGRDHGIKVDFRGLTKSARKLRLVENLPYTISTPLLFRPIEQARGIDDMHFML